MYLQAKIAKRTKAYLGASLLLPVLLLSAVTSQAAVIETLQDDWGNGGNAVCCDSEFVTNYDDNGAISGVAQGFSLSHSAATGDLTFTIGSSTPAVIDLPGPDPVDAPLGYGWGTIAFLIATPGNKNYVVRLENLVLNSVDTGLVSLNGGNDLVTGEKKDKSKALILNEDVNGFFYDFTITGDLTFDWAGNPKSQDLQFNIGVADQTAVPVPAAVWLFGSALGFLGWQNRRKGCARAARKVS